uniref:Zgc:113276 n=1 Tax=Oryzias latipes TaxID=8090 RepID=A0A3P9LE15_ORYLA
MVVLDVLVIGGGPHALTLASLLSAPETDTSADCEHDPLLTSCTLEPQRCLLKPEPSNNKGSNGKRKKRQPTGHHMAEEQQSKLSMQECVCPSLRFQVVDTYGDWAALWESQFAALSIPHLRSHALVHTDPLKKTALQEFVVKHERSEELHTLPDRVYILDKNTFFNDMRLGKKEKKRLHLPSTLKKSLAFSLPGTKLSVDFFKDQVQRYKLDKVLVKDTVENIIPVTVDNTDMEDDQAIHDQTSREIERIRDGVEKRVKYFKVQLQEGGVVKVHHVVIATGPTRAQMANIPSWVQNIGESYPEESLQHTVHLMHWQPKSKQKLEGTNGQHSKETFSNQVCEAGQRVMVVGGGLTSAHVVSVALQQGASHVTWVMRKHLQLKQFDVGDVESLVGRYSHVEHGIKMDGQAYLRQFYTERSLHKRLAMIRQARKGGAVTPEAYIQLQPFILSGQVEVKTYCQVNEARWCYKDQAWSLSLSTGDCWTGDRIWLATGCKLDVNQDPLLTEVMKEFPIQVLDGWPCITENLKWTEGCPLYLMGQYAALQVIKAFPTYICKAKLVKASTSAIILQKKSFPDWTSCSEPGWWTGCQHANR